MTGIDQRSDLMPEIEAYLGADDRRLGFTPRLEALFAEAMAPARSNQFLRFSLAGLVFYNLFLITDLIMLPDAFVAAVVIQLVIVTPFCLVTIWLMARRRILPETSVMLSLMAIVLGINALAFLSSSVYAGYLVFTLPLCLLYGNIVLPLPFWRSVVFTSVCLAVGTATTLLIQGLDGVTRPFALLVNWNAGGFMLVATFRMEASERRGFLFGLRETMRAEALAENNRMLRTLSETDGLTGVGNRRSFDVALDRFWQAHRTTGRTLALLLVDIDHFKRLNDTLGHQAGDRCLRMVAECLQADLRAGTDFLARYGGEEFAVLLQETDAEAAALCAERLRCAVETLAMMDGEAHRKAPLTISVGYAVMTAEQAMQTTALVACADAALFLAKGKGRNRIHPPLPGRAGASLTLVASPDALAR